MANVAGTCQVGTGKQAVSNSWTSINNTIEANTIYAPFTENGVVTAGRVTTIRGNVFQVEQGKPDFGPVAGGAISLFEESFGNKTNPDWGATVTRNTVSKVWPALTLGIRLSDQPSPEDAFTARIGLNDFFTVYGTANGERVPNPTVRVMTNPPPLQPGEYNIGTDISTNFLMKIPPVGIPLTGNFWGVDCPDRFLSSKSTPTIVLVEGTIKSGVVVDDSKALDDTVARTIESLIVDYVWRPQPRCPPATAEMKARPKSR